MYASLTGSNGSGVFDSLYVRSPENIGPFVSVLGAGGVVSGKRDISDSFSQEEILDRLASQAAGRYTKAEADALFETGSDVAAGLALKRDVATSYSREALDGFLDSKVAETTYQAGISLKQDKEGSYTSNEVDGLLDEKVATTTYQAGLSQKQDKEGSYTSNEVDGLLNGKVANSRVLTDVPENATFTDTVYSAPSSRPISYITGLQGELDSRAGQSATTVALSNKVDKEGSISASESSANLLARVQTAVPSGALFTDTISPSSRPISYITGLQGELDNRAGQSATTVALSNKVDKEGSISASESSANLLARVQTAVPSGALFTDTVFNRNTDIPNGSLEIIQVAQLTAALSTFKSASDSDTADTVLQNNINALEETVEAIPTSQLLVNGSFFNQARFSIANSIQQLNLGLGLWEWLVQPTWSDVQRDNARIRHAKMGHLPLDPASDCLVYLPFAGSTLDMGPSTFTPGHPNLGYTGYLGCL